MEGETRGRRKEREEGEANKQVAFINRTQKNNKEERKEEERWRKGGRQAESGPVKNVTLGPAR